ncbi:MAG TPA: glycosyltransferase [Candidatus Acidoferrales bacterium]|nr:glycosyltransferase [Candidatus Acidoferrales bacterium]
MLVHNYYQRGGGEDEVFRSDVELLRSTGHEVIEYVRHNDEIRDYGIGNKSTLGFRTIWAWDTARELRDLLGRKKPHVAHFHNTFPLISPSAYYACQEAGVPVVQTLHNYRLLCPAATLFRDGHICEECVDHTLWRSFFYGCYRESRPATAAVAAMLAFHRRKNTWLEMADCFIALTEFSRGKFIDAGFPEQKLVVKSNFLLPDPGERSVPGDYALFLGRLSPEKGLHTLLAAWGRLSRQHAMKIVGDGPLRTEIERLVSENELSNVRLVGAMPHDEAVKAIREARFLILPSVWYECFPMTLVESFACGVPVIASRLGAMAEIVDDGRTGLHFKAGDAADLASKVEWAWTHPAEMEAIGRAARSEYEVKYTGERNYQTLLRIYETAISKHATIRQCAK